MTVTSGDPETRKVSKLTWGSCGPKAPTGRAERVFVGCVLAGFSSEAAEEASPSSSISRPKHAAAGRGRLLEDKRDRKPGRMRSHGKMAGPVHREQVILAVQMGRARER